MIEERLTKNIDKAVYEFIKVLHSKGYSLGEIKVQLSIITDDILNSFSK